MHKYLLKILIAQVWIIYAFKWAIRGLIMCGCLPWRPWSVLLRSVAAEQSLPIEQFFCGRSTIASDKTFYLNYTRKHFKICLMWLNIPNRHIIRPNKYIQKTSIYFKGKVVSHFVMLKSIYLITFCSMRASKTFDFSDNSFFHNSVKYLKISQALFLKWPV